MMLRLFVTIFFALLLGACSTLQLAYPQASRFSYHWLDRYVDFDEMQQPQVRDALDTLFQRARHAVLPAVAEDLREVQAALGGEISPAAMCRWGERLRVHRDTLMELAWPAAADLANALAPAQLDHIAVRQREADAKERRKLLPEGAEARRDAAVEQLAERAERIYGSLEPEQTELLQRWVREAPMDMAGWLDWRRERQRELHALLRDLERPGSADASGQRLRAWWRQAYGRPSEGSLHGRHLEHGCRMASALHASITPRQRATALERVATWIEDLKALSSP